MVETTKTSIERLLETHLKGLILPEEQSTIESSYWLLALTLLILLIIFYLIWKGYQYRKSPRQQARRKITKLRKGLSLGERHQDLATQLSRILRQGLEATRLDQHQPKNLEWQAFVKKLEAASFAKLPCPITELEILFKQTNRWLKEPLTKKE